MSARGPRKGLRRRPGGCWRRRGGPLRSTLRIIAGRGGGIERASGDGVLSSSGAAGRAGAGQGASHRHPRARRRLAPAQAPAIHTRGPPPAFRGSSRFRSRVTRWRASGNNKTRRPRARRPRSRREARPARFAVRPGRQSSLHRPAGRGPGYRPRTVAMGGRSASRMARTSSWKWSCPYRICFKLCCMASIRARPRRSPTRCMAT